MRGRRPERLNEVKIRLSDDEHAALKAHAHRTHRSLTATVLHATLREIEGVHDDSVTAAALVFASQVRRLLTEEQEAAE